MTDDNKFSIEGVAAHAGIGSLASDEGQIKGVAAHAVVADMSMPVATLTGVSATASVGQLRVEIHEPLPEAHPIYALVGRVASEWSRYEGVLDAIIWELASLHGPVGACITAQIMSAGSRLISIKALAKEKQLWDRAKNDLGQIEARTFGLQPRRNRAVHDPWYWEISTKETKQHKSKPKEQLTFGLVPVEEAVLGELIREILELIELASKLRLALSA
jgi:hypothetical protein